MFLSIFQVSPGKLSEQLSRTRSEDGYKNSGDKHYNSETTVHSEMIKNEINYSDDYSVVMLENEGYEGNESLEGYAEECEEGEDCKHKKPKVSIVYTRYTIITLTDNNA